MGYGVEMIEGKKVVIYDMDNTLVATDAYFRQHIKETTELLNIRAPSPKDLNAVQRKNFQFEDVFKELFNSLAEEVIVAYRKTAPDKLYFATTGAVKFVTELNEKGIVSFQGILTNRTNMADIRLKQAGFSEFDFIFSPPSDELRKPHPGAFNTAVAWCKERGLDKESIFTIGDHLNDFESAHVAGIDFFAVLTGETTREDFTNVGLEDARIFNNLEELRNKILNF